MAADLVRRLLSILLLAVFGLPFILPLLAMGQDAEAGLPACCRRNGKHHCIMSMAQRASLATTSKDPQFTAPVEKCPYCPSSVAPSRPTSLGTPAAATAIASALQSHPTGVAQTEARGRIARDRSHRKRGPPALTTA